MELCNNIVTNYIDNQNSFLHWSKFEEFSKIIRPKIKRQFLLRKTCFFYAVQKTALLQEQQQRDETGGGDWWFSVSKIQL